MESPFLAWQVPDAINSDPPNKQRASLVYLRQDLRHIKKTPHLIAESFLGRIPKVEPSHLSVGPAFSIRLRERGENSYWIKNFGTILPTGNFFVVQRSSI